jgi:hypothetical protein
MLRTEWFSVCIRLADHFLLIEHRVKGFATYPAPNQIQCYHIIPLSDQKVLKLDGFLRTDSPALTAASAFGHIVLQGSSIVPIAIT